MNAIEQIERNVTDSFRLAKNDILALQQNVVTLAQTQERIVELLETLRNNEMQLYQRMKELKKPVVKRITGKKAEFSAARSGKKFHDKKCPFAQNIKPKNKLKFDSKTRALNQGFKPCNCVR